jgi:hypothetical protein
MSVLELPLGAPAHAHVWRYYGGALGYESMRCACGLDILDDLGEALAMAQEEDARRATVRRIWP